MQIKKKTLGVTGSKQQFLNTAPKKRLAHEHLRAKDMINFVAYRLIADFGDDSDVIIRSQSVQGTVFEDSSDFQDHCLCFDREHSCVCRSGVVCQHSSNIVFQGNPIYSEKGNTSRVNGRTGSMETLVRSNFEFNASNIAYILTRVPTALRLLRSYSIQLDQLQFMEDHSLWGNPAESFLSAWAAYGLLHGLYFVYYNQGDKPRQIHRLIDNTSVAAVRQKNDVKVDIVSRSPTQDTEFIGFQSIDASIERLDFDNLPIEPEQIVVKTIASKDSDDAMMSALLNQSDDFPIELISKAQMKIEKLFNVTIEQEKEACANEVKKLRQQLTNADQKSTVKLHRDMNYDMNSYRDFVRISQNSNQITVRPFCTDEFYAKHKNTAQGQMVLQLFNLSSEDLFDPDMPEEEKVVEGRLLHQSERAPEGQIKNLVLSCNDEERFADSIKCIDAQLRNSVDVFIDDVVHYDKFEIFDSQIQIKKMNDRVEKKVNTQIMSMYQTSKKHIADYHYNPDLSQLKALELHLHSILFNKNDKEIFRFLQQFTQVFTMCHIRMEYERAQKDLQSQVQFYDAEKQDVFKDEFIKCSSDYQPYDFYKLNRSMADTLNFQDFISVCQQMEAAILFKRSQVQKEWFVELRNEFIWYNDQAREMMKDTGVHQMIPDQEMRTQTVVNSVIDGSYHIIRITFQTPYAERVDMRILDINKFFASATGSDHGLFIDRLTELFNSRKLEEENLPANEQFFLVRNDRHRLRSGELKQLRADLQFLKTQSYDYMLLDKQHEREASEIFRSFVIQDVYEHLQKEQLQELGLSLNVIKYYQLVMFDRNWNTGVMQDFRGSTPSQIHNYMQEHVDPLSDAQFDFMYSNFILKQLMEKQKEDIQYRTASNDVVQAMKDRFNRSTRKGFKRARIHPYVAYSCIKHIFQEILSPIDSLVYDKTYIDQNRRPRNSSSSRIKKAPIGMQDPNCVILDHGDFEIITKPNYPISYYQGDDHPSYGLNWNAVYNDKILQTIKPKPLRTLENWSTLFIFECFGRIKPSDKTIILVFCKKTGVYLFEISICDDPCITNLAWIKSLDPLPLHCNRTMFVSYGCMFFRYPTGETEIASFQNSLFRLPSSNVTQVDRNVLIFRSQQCTIIVVDTIEKTAESYRNFYKFTTQLMQPSVTKIKIYNRLHLEGVKALSKLPFIQRMKQPHTNQFKITGTHQTYNWSTADKISSDLRRYEPEQKDVRIITYLNDPLLGDRKAEIQRLEEKMVLDADERQFKDLQMALMARISNRWEKTLEQLVQEARQSKGFVRQFFKFQFDDRVYNLVSPIQQRTMNVTSLAHDSVQSFLILILNKFRGHFSAKLLQDCETAKILEFSASYQELQQTVMLGKRDLTFRVVYCGDIKGSLLQKFVRFARLTNQPPIEIQEGIMRLDVVIELKTSMVDPTHHVKNLQHSKYDGNMKMLFTFRQIFATRYLIDLFFDFLPFVMAVHFKTQILKLSSYQKLFVQNIEKAINTQVVNMVKNEMVYGTVNYEQDPGEILKFFRHTLYVIDKFLK